MISFSSKEDRTTALKQIHNTIIKIGLSYVCYIMLNPNRRLLNDTIAYIIIRFHFSNVRYGANFLNRC